jgi:hypothetical protein
VWVVLQLLLRRDVLLLLLLLLLLRVLVLMMLLLLVLMLLMLLLVVLVLVLMLVRGVEWVVAEGLLCEEGVADGEGRQGRAPAVVHGLHHRGRQVGGPVRAMHGAGVAPLPAAPAVRSREAACHRWGRPRLVSPRAAAAAAAARKN